MHLDVSRLTIYLTLWGALGPLVGILVGHVLSRSWQRKQWLMDQRASEFRELVVALEDSLRAHLTKYLFTEAFNREEHGEILGRQISFFTVVRTRIFTRNDVEHLNADERWGEAIHDYKAAGDIEVVRKSNESLMRDLVKAATKK